MLNGLVCLIATMIVLAGPAAAADPASEPPVLRDRVRDGALPPMAERLPAEPLVLDPRTSGGSLGRYGGRLRTLMGTVKDTRILIVYGYARLVRFAPDWQLVPDIVERFDVHEGRAFTFHLRKGHKWSDGQPFTSEDFRYVWEDVLGDSDLSPFGLPSYLLVDGRPPRFEVLGETAVRYTWDKPNPRFLQTIAAPRPEYLFLPAHYLRQFHARYADAESLQRLVRQERQRDWVALHYAKSAQYRNTNPDLPSLQPWVLTTEPPASYFEFERNPYFHRVDPTGKQLPYIDEVAFSVVSTKLIPAKTAAGDSDLQARGIGFENAALLLRAQKRSPIRVLFWRTAAGAELALYPNLNVKDPVWRQVLRDPNVRRALSLGINRDEINEVVFFGLAEEGANTVLADSELHRPELSALWARYDPEAADRLLDAAGILRPEADEPRRLPDGRPFGIVAETAGEDPIETDVLQLIADTWSQIGIELFIKPTQRELLRNRSTTGDTVLSIWKGLENAVPTAEMSPRELAPTSSVQLNWPRWGQYFETRGQAGEPVDIQTAAELLSLYEAWERTTDPRVQADLWKRMLAIHAEEVFSIGIVRNVPQPVVVSDRLRNVPEKAIYNWDPGAHFGVYSPDTFWLDQEAGR